MCENIKDCCRICLDVESDHVPILDDPTIQLQIKSCLSVTVSANDRLPKQICTACVGQLGDFYNFQLNARCSLDWLEYNAEQQAKKPLETKLPIQPLPDSEYNSDSLLEFLNNTANIEEYLNNLGKEDIPSIVNMLDRNQENSLDGATKLTNMIKNKQPSPKKKDSVKTNSSMNMEIDVLDSDIEIVKEIIMKESEPKKTHQDRDSLVCFGCNMIFESLNRMTQHLSSCDNALRTCKHCNYRFDSKLQLQNHSHIHNTKPFTCNCSKKFSTKEKLIQHQRQCHMDNTASTGCLYRCKQCKEIFKERFKLYKHAKEHVMKMEERICDICGHILIGTDALTKHRKEVHGQCEDSLYRCKICHHTSSSYKDIYLHVQGHCPTPKPEERHLCDTCGKSFTTRATLLRHVNLHVMEYKCSICKKVFRDVKSRDEHVLGHVDMTMCEKCGQNVSSYKLEAHSCM